jgi:hypothetical protein
MALAFPESRKVIGEQKHVVVEKHQEAGPFGKVTFLLRRKSMLRRLDHPQPRPKFAPFESIFSARYPFER